MRSDITSLKNLPTFGQNRSQTHWSILHCSASKRVPWLKHRLLLSQKLRISAPRYCGRDFCVVGDVICVSAITLLRNLPTFGQNRCPNKWSILYCSATERGPWLKHRLLLSQYLDRGAPRDCGRDFCVFGAVTCVSDITSLKKLPMFGQNRCPKSLVNFTLQCDWTRCPCFKH